MVPDKARAKKIMARFKQSGRKFINFSASQIKQFSGNTIKLKGHLALSHTANCSLAADQVILIEENVHYLSYKFYV